MEKQKHLPKSIRKYIRRKKQEIRKKIHDPILQEEEIKKLYKEIFSKIKKK